MVQETRTPTFCVRCGSKLQVNEDITGYDPYTGDPEKATDLYCNNPTVIVRSLLFGRTATEFVQHPTWSQVDGAWEQN